MKTSALTRSSSNLITKKLDTTFIKIKRLIICKIIFHVKIFCIFSVCMSTLQPCFSQYLMKTDKEGKPTFLCEESESPTECLRNLIFNTDVVFEGTVLKNEFFETPDKRWFIKVSFLVHKVFKQSTDLLPDTAHAYLETRAPDFIDKDGKMHISLKENESYKVGADIGRTGILFFDKSKESLSFDKKSAYDLTFFLDYHLSQDVPEHFLKKDEIVLVHTLKQDEKYGSIKKVDRLSFKNTKELYDLMSSVTNTKFIDKTKKHFQKKNEIRRNISPQIGFYTDIVAAGVGNKFLIHGENLGNQDISSIFLDHDADDLVGADYLEISKSSLPSDYIHTWTDQKIELELPSLIAYKKSILSGQFIVVMVVPVSGRFVVGKEVGENTEYSPYGYEYFLDIPYALENKAIGYTISPDGSNLEIQNVYKTKLSSSTEGNIIEFVIDTELKSNPIIWNLLIEAMNEWTCRTGVNWKVISESNDPNSFMKGDGINSIALKSNLFGNGDGATTLAECDDNFYNTVELDLFLSPSYVAANHSPQKIYHTLLHELGHLLGLRHTYPGLDGEFDVMISGSDKETLGAPNGEISIDDVAGALKMKSFSIDQSICNSVADFSATRAFGSFDVQATQESAPGAEDGSVDLTINDLGDSYTVQWSNGATTEDLTNVIGGNYSVSITFGGGQCQEIIDIDIQTCPEITVTGLFTSVVPSGCGQTDGNIYVRGPNANGGQPPYTWHWENGQGTIIPPASLESLPSGTYCYVATDANGCTGRKCVSIQSPGDPELVLYGTLPDCDNLGNGLIQLEVYNPSDASMTYDFHWSFGTDYLNMNVVEVENLQAGSYSVTITPSEDIGVPCEIIYNFDIEALDSEPLEVYGDIIHPCPGENNGNISLNLSGGYGLYGTTEIVWNDGASGVTRSSVPIGNYTVNITDHCGWTIEETYILESLATSHTLYPGCKDEGEIFINSTGGNTPHTYLWSNGGSSQYETDLESGAYAVTIFDNQNCSVIESDVLINKEYYLEEIEPCAGLNDGSLNLEIFNPLQESVSLIYNGVGISTLPPALSTQYTFDNIPENSDRTLNISIGECEYNETINLNPKITNKVFSHETDRVCYYDDYCNGQKVGTNTYQTNAFYDVNNGVSSFWGDCHIPGYCYTYPGQIQVSTWHFDTRKVKGFEYLMIVQAAYNSTYINPSYLDMLVQYYENRGIKACEVVRYCPANLKIIATFDDLFNDLDGITQLSNTCWHIDCIWPSKDRTFCIEDVVPDYFDGSVNFDDFFPTPETCDIRKYNVYQLILWKDDLEQELTSYANSQLEAFLNTVSNDPDKLEKSKCTNVRFCVNDFSILTPFPNFTLIDCNESSELCNIYTTTEGGMQYTYCPPGFVNPRDFTLDYTPIFFKDDFPGATQFLTGNGNGFNQLQFLPDDTESTVFHRFGYLTDGGYTIPKGIFKSEDSNVFYFNDFTHSSIYLPQEETSGLIHYFDNFEDNYSLHFLTDTVQNELVLIYQDSVSSWSRPFNASGFLKIEQLTGGINEILVGGIFGGTLYSDSNPLAESNTSNAIIIRISKTTGTILSTTNVGSIDLNQKYEFTNGENSIMFLGNYLDQGIEVNSSVHPMSQNEGGVKIRMEENGNLGITETVSLSSGMQMIDVATDIGVNTFLINGNGNVTSNSNIIYSSTGNQLALLSIDNTGNLLWAKNFQISNAIIHDEVDVKRKGNITYLGITFEGTLYFDGNSVISAGGKDITILAIDAQGNTLGYQRFGDTDSEILNELFVNEVETIYFGGSIEGNVGTRQIGSFSFVKLTSSTINPFISFISREELLNNSLPLTEEGNNMFQTRIETSNDVTLQRRLLVFPNPFNHTINVSLEYPRSQSSLFATIEVVNIFGSRVFSKNIDISESSSYDVRIGESSSWPVGLYYVKVKFGDNGKFLCEKVIKSK